MFNRVRQMKSKFPVLGNVTFWPGLGNCIPQRLSSELYLAGLANTSLLESGNIEGFIVWEETAWLYYRRYSAEQARSCLSMTKSVLLDAACTATSMHPEYAEAASSLQKTNNIRSTEQAWLRHVKAKHEQRLIIAPRHTKPGESKGVKRLAR
jgi:hypothetical protein